MIGGKISYNIFRSLFLKVRYVSLPNLILGREAVREFVMNEMRYETILPEFRRLLADADYRSEMATAFSELAAAMGEKGAARRAGEMMAGLLAGSRTNNSG